MVLLEWLKVFKTILKIIPIGRIQGDCISLIGSLTDTSERILSRKIGAMITCYISAIIPCSEYLKTYITFLKKVSEDSNWEVREIVAREIPSLCQSLGPNSIDQLFAILGKLLEDPQPEIFSYSAESLGLILGQCKNMTLFGQVVKKLKTALSIPNSGVLKTTINNIGKILVGLGKESLERDEELDIIFQTIIKVAIEKDLEGSGVALAKSLPAIVFVYGAKAFVSHLFKVIEKLMTSKTSSSILARATFANCFHEIAKLFGSELATEKLKEYFFSLLTDSEIIIIDSILNHIEITISIFSPQTKQELSTVFYTEYFSKLPQVHQKIKAKSWRTEVEFLEHFTGLIAQINPERMTNTLMPIFKAVLASSPRICKLRIFDMLSQMLAGFCQNPIRLDIHTLTKRLVKSPFHKNRIDYLDFLCAI